MLTYSYLGEAVEALPEPARTVMNTEVTNASQSQQQLQASNNGTNDSGFAALPADWTITQNNQASTQAQGSGSASTQTTQTPVQAQVAQGALIQPPPQSLAQAPAITQPAPAPAPHPAPPQANHHPPANMARVFKLQFDARRIICCSQTSVIVGWDFANDDEQIIEASRFFAPIE